MGGGAASRRYFSKNLGWCMSYKRVLVFVLADVVALVAASSQIVQHAPVISPSCAQARLTNPENS